MMQDTASDDPARPVGRPRDQAIEGRLHDAALRILEEHDPSALTIDRVCDVAGVSRATFYRRWRSIAPVIVGLAHAMIARSNPRTTSTGSLRDDLSQEMHNLAALLADPRAGQLFRYVFTQMSANAEYRALVDAVVEARDMPIVAAIRGAIARGDLRDDIEPTFVIFQLAGPLWHRRVLLQLPLGPTFVDQVIDTVLRGIARFPAPPSPE